MSSGRKTRKALLKRFIKAGSLEDDMRTLEQNGIEKVMQGITDMKQRKNGLY